MWCVGELNEGYKGRMEDVLDLYERFYDKSEPVICFDEKLHHLVSDVKSPLPMKRGSIKKRDYEIRGRGVVMFFVWLSRDI